MKTIRYSILIILLLTVCSCGGTKRAIKNVDKKVIVTAGSVTSKFKWGKIENINIKPQFIMESMNYFEPKKMSLVNIYNRNGNTIELIQNEKGIMNYYKLAKDASGILNASFDEAVDSSVMKHLQSDEELWGYDMYGDFLAVIKNTGTEVYKDDNLIFKLDGIAKIDDIDNDKTVEMVTKSDDGSTIDIYKFINNNFIKIWEYVSKNKTLNGNIQIGDLNGDGVKEIYIGDNLGTARKFIITNDGIGEDSDFPIKKEKTVINSEFYIVDYNGDGKMDIVTVDDGEKPVLYIHK